MNLEQEIKIMEIKENYKLAGFTNPLDNKISLEDIDETNYVPRTEETSEEISNAKEQILEEQPQPSEEESFEEQPAEEHSIISAEIPAPAEEEGELQENIDDGRKRKIIIFGAAAIILIIAIMGIILTNPSSLTGYTIATREIQQTTNISQVFSQNTETQLELNNIISFKISGKLEGTEAKVKLRINGTDYLVADIVNPEAQNQTLPEQILQYTIKTDKTSYALGQTVTIAVTPGIENKSLYVSYGEQTQKLDNNTFIPQELGEYEAIALITLPDDILRLEVNFTVINETTNETTNETITPEPVLTEIPDLYEFIELCSETCTVPENSNPILIIETAENSTLTITQITTTQTKENNAPMQIKPIPDITITAGQTTITDLNEYFSDIDGDTMQYDINEIPEIDATITQNILTITSATPGIYTAYIYAIDGDQLVTSNTFQVTIEPSGEANEVILPNITANETLIVALPIADACSDPDPNKRPIECLDNAQYFQEQTILIENTARTPVARVTPIGNLIISGEVIERDSFTPAEGDYTIGYEDDYGNKQTTVWFDSSTGNVHLKGRLYEEKINSEPSPGSFVIRNKKGIVLMWGDSVAGDMYIRGNVISFRKNIMR